MPLAAHSLKPAVALALLLIASFFSFSPGLSGPFLFDDIPNLSALADQASDTRQGALQFVFGSAAGPGGRPLAQASFLLDDTDWPSTPERFKRTNLLLHLLTGLVLFQLARQLLRSRDPHTQSHDWLALAAAALWLLHPLQAATVFLVVQRMTILCTLFMALSLSALLAARERLLIGRAGPALGMTALAGLAAVLAALCKETAALLPLLATAIERTVAPLPRTRGGRALRLLGLWLPSLAVLAYVSTLSPFHERIDWRGFSPAERLLTEGRVLLDYLGQILRPGLQVSLYYDNYPIQRLGEHPLKALWPWLLLVSAALLAWWRAQKAPWLAFALLFFLAGHALEAAPISIELYFLHRNYLPMFGLLLGLTAATKPWLARVKKGTFSLPATVALLLSLLLAALTHTVSQTWGDEGRLYNVWAAENPGSPRARLSNANYWALRGDEARALSELEDLLARNPDHLTADLASYYLECRLGRESAAHWQALTSGIAGGRYGYDAAALPTVEKLIDNIRNGRCKQITQNEVIALLDRLSENPVYAGKDGQLIYNLIAQLFAAQGDAPAALAALELALQRECSDTLWRAAAGLREQMTDLPGAVDALEQARACDARKGLGRWLLDDTPRRTELDRWIAELRKRLPAQS